MAADPEDPAPSKVSVHVRRDELAPVQSDPDANLTLWQAIKKWRRVVLYCVGLTSGILMFGYDYVIVGTTSAMPSFQKDFGERLDGRWILPSLWLGLWTLASPAVSIPSSLAAGWFQDCYGRRASLALGSFLSAGAVAVCYVSNLPPSIGQRRGVFLAGKGFQGGAIGIVMTTTQTYMSEIVPPILRGPLLAFFPIFALLGQLIGAAVIFGCLDVENGYVLCFASQWPFSAVPLFMALLIPESPTFLVREDKLKQAYKAQERLSSDDADARKTIEAICRNIEHEKKTTRARYIDCFRGTNCRRTLIVMFASILPQMFGLTLLAKASYFVQVVGMSSTTSVLVLILGLVCGLLANLSSIWISSRIGRRRLILISLAIITALWAAMGIAGIWNGPAVVWYTAITLILVVVVAGLGVWPSSYAVGSETSSLHLRAMSQGVGWLTSGFGAGLFGFVLPYIFNPDKGNLKAKTGFVFAGLCAIAFVISFFCVPDMKGRTASEIDRMFEFRLPTRQFRKWTNHDDASTRGMIRDVEGPV
ncbi:major facilitator superfamily protein [Hirsutella rhossiliensis]|uniref:Sugar transporter domain-containing protein n=1 Tax=Hirsutella rhossiliensis TaxID=111463 RepID=A0A9P8SG49_9HYPO|nr:sugar transporter domain-containing protein [Hirsutella rhossiliensis]KAH0961441.1 sugar transporter domain-containing protein [Hirsutella rhossiliensis]